MVPLLSRLVWRSAPFLAFAVAAVALWRVPDVPAAEVRYVRIAAGPATSLGFQGATTLANALTRPPGLPPCDEGRPCGVPGVIALAQSLPEPEAIVAAVATGQIDTGLAPANIVFGARCPEGRTPALDVTVLGDAYAEALHVLALPGSGIAAVPDLRGKRVAVGAAGSEDRRLADRILMAHELRRRDIRMVELAGDAALAALAEGKVDAVFRIAAVPDPAVAGLAAAGAVVLVPVEGDARQRLLELAPFSGAARIPGGTYGEAGEVQTLAQPVLWIAGPGLPTGLAAELSGAVENPANRALLTAEPVALFPVALFPVDADAFRPGRLAAPLHPAATSRHPGASPMPCPEAR
ncbi:TAXI family TRAP transporter solute-binding subunit [Rhodospirillum centenum]|uniref:TRAP transporter solute receptor, TAXI family protein n=1 Tax=Rhodospirillum centenum (strain ATCC 51521 / SW) TaxID=414684 RepID=B6IPG0_RHOCS|nr:TAXI family TRAP transporter solute-binding subunit [Rhodospirillum centenum]ACI99662.1 TRAP transporter solute receptor, TAXI family protein [Rhodospirillum centenum SW]